MKRAIDILFVHPNASEKIYQGLASKNSAIEPPIWHDVSKKVCYENHSAEILDAEYLYSSRPKIISEYNARIVCFVVYGQQPSASSQNMEGATKTYEIVKNISPNQFILFWAYARALPSETLLDMIA